jgi:hypothetical protein
MFSSFYPTTLNDTLMPVEAIFYREIIYIIGTIEYYRPRLHQEARAIHNNIPSRMAPSKYYRFHTFYQSWKHDGIAIKAYYC